MTYLFYNWKESFDSLHPFDHPSLPLVTTNLLQGFCVCLCVCVFFQRFYIKVRSYNICLSLIYFTKYNALQVPSCCHKWQDFPHFCDWIILHCIYIFCYCIYTFSLSIHPLMDTGCPHILDIVNNAVINGGAYIFLN